MFIIVGIVAALVIGDRRWEARGGERGVIYDIALWAVPFGLIGGRLYHVITDWRTYFGDDGAGLSGALRIWDGGLGIWGAVALGGVGAWIGCRRHGIPLPAFGDAIAPGIILAQAIGRLGNYFNQELYGRPTTLPWGLEVYERRNANGVPDSLNGVSTGQPLIPGVEAVHPTFLYELLWNLLVFAALIWIDRRFKIGHGRLFAMYVAGYCVGRFWIELMRSDVATQIGGIRVNSFTSTFVFIGAVVYIMVAPKGREDPASLAGKPEKVEEEEDTAVEDFVKELTAVAATTGVVAAAKAAGEAEDEDATAAEDEKEAEEPAVEDPDAEAEPKAEAEEAESEEEPEAEEEPGSEAAAEAEELGADVAGVPAGNLAEAEEFAADGDGEPEAVSEAAEAEDVAEAPPEDIAEAEEAPDEAGESALSEETTAEEAETEPEAEQPATEDGAEAAPEDETEAESIAGVGTVEGDEAAEANEATPEPDAAAVEAEEVAAEEPETDEPEPDEPETDEPETEDAEAAVEEADESEPSDEEAEAVVEAAETAEEQEPEPEVLEEEPEPEVAAQSQAAEVTEPAVASGGRLSRWLRRRGR
jgi:prolipoprotein diacylglyceryl transferase